MVIADENISQACAGLKLQEAGDWTSQNGGTVMYEALNFAAARRRIDNKDLPGERHYYGLRHLDSSGHKLKPSFRISPVKFSHSFFGLAIKVLTMIIHKFDFQNASSSSLSKARVIVLEKI